MDSLCRFLSPYPEAAQLYPGGAMDDLLERYEELLGEVDRWFDSCLERYPDLIVCRRGCSACCRGLFDITLLDALLLKRGIDRLEAGLRQDIRGRAAARLAGLNRDWPGYRAPWTLNHLPESQWDAMMPEDDETPCPLLSDEGECRVYASRPMTCRLNGIPLIDTGGEELFDDWCSLNFIGVDPQQLDDLRHSFRDLFAQELLLFRELTRRLFGRAVSELDTIVPAAVFLDNELLRTVRLP